MVVYGADTSTNPARVFWTFEYAGHEAVYFLDGGAAAWGARSTTTDVPRKAAEPYVIASPRLHLWKGKDDVKAAIAAGGVSLVDARSSGEFVGGHIQGALSLDWNLALAGGALRPHDELTALYSGIENGVPIINYCQTGARASVNYLVQRHLGRADVSVYDGSWSEWSSLDSSEYPREPAP